MREDTKDLSCYDPSEYRAACYYMHLEDGYDGAWCGDDCPVREREEMLRDLDAIYGRVESGFLRTDGALTHNAED